MNGMPLSIRNIRPRPVRKSRWSLPDGWVEIDGKWYFFNADPASPTYSYDPVTQTWIWNGADVLPYGAMLKNTTTPDQSQVDENGARID
jgi:glucan-binding YG repeat protein